MRFVVWLSEPLRARTRLLLDRARKGDAARRGSLPPNRRLGNVGNQPGQLAAKREGMTCPLWRGSCGSVTPDDSLSRAWFDWAGPHDGRDLSLHH
jgi:hypothetical protein